MQKPKAISLARAKEFTKEKVKTFFKIVHPELQEKYVLIQPEF
jgi:hypothetical protein